MHDYALIFEYQHRMQNSGAADTLVLRANATTMVKKWGNLSFMRGRNTHAERAVGGFHQRLAIRGDLERDEFLLNMSGYSTHGIT